MSRTDSGTVGELLVMRGCSLLGVSRVPGGAGDFAVQEVAPHDPGAARVVLVHPPRPGVPPVAVQSGRGLGAAGAGRPERADGDLVGGAASAATRTACRPRSSSVTVRRRACRASASAPTASANASTAHSAEARVP